MLNHPSLLHVLTQPRSTHERRLRDGLSALLRDFSDLSYLTLQRVLWSAWVVSTPSLPPSALPMLRCHGFTNSELPDISSQRCSRTVGELAEEVLMRIQMAGPEGVSYADAAAFFHGEVVPEGELASLDPVLARLGSLGEVLRKGEQLIAVEHAEAPSDAVLAHATGLAMDAGADGIPLSELARHLHQWNQEHPAQNVELGELVVTLEAFGWARQEGRHLVAVDQPTVVRAANAGRLGVEPMLATMGRIAIQVGHDVGASIAELRFPVRASHLPQLGDLLQGMVAEFARDHAVDDDDDEPTEVSVVLALGVRS